jgi:hydrogenase maturation protease
MILVIGYGNELRRDDGVGPRVARAVAGWGRPGVVAEWRHQLTPELVEMIAGAGAVVFVDAALGDGDVRICPIGSMEPRSVFNHISSPTELLALSQVLHDRRPPAWLVSVPAADFGFGEQLSPCARRGMEEALRHICRLIASETAP